MSYPVEYRYVAQPLNGQGKRFSKIHIAATGTQQAMCGADTTGAREQVSAVAEEVCARCKPHAALVVRLSAKEAMHRFRENGNGHLIDFPLTCRTPSCTAREVHEGLCETCWADA